MTYKAVEEIWVDPRKFRQIVVDCFLVSCGLLEAVAILNRLTNILLGPPPVCGYAISHL